MATFKMIAKQGVSGSSGGIRNKDLPSSRGGKLNSDGGIASRHAGPTTRGKAAVGTFGQQVARVSASSPVRGQVTSSGGKFRTNTAGVQHSGTTGRGKAAGGAPAVRVSASGPPPAGDAPLSFASQRNKNLTMGMSTSPRDNPGYSGSSEGRRAVGQTGSGVGKKRKFGSY